MFWIGVFSSLFHAMLFTAKLMKSYMNIERITRKFMMFINSRLKKKTRHQKILVNIFNLKYMYTCIKMILNEL